MRKILGLGVVLVCMMVQVYGMQSVEKTELSSSYANDVKVVQGKVSSDIEVSLDGKDSGVNYSDIISECVELSSLQFDINGDGNSSVSDIIAGQNAILGTDFDTEATCDGTFVPASSDGTQGVCCPEGSICDLNCSGNFTVRDLIIMRKIILGTFEGPVCGVPLCEETDLQVESIDLSDVQVNLCIENVDTVKFEIDNGDSVAVVSHGFTIQGMVNDSDPLGSEHVGTVRIRRLTSGGYELLQERSGLEIDSQGVLVFDEFEPFITAIQGFETILVTADIQDTETVVGDYITMKLIATDFRTVSGGVLPSYTADSTRKIEIVAKESLTVSYSNTLQDILEDLFAKVHVLAGESLSDTKAVARFDLTSYNGFVEVQDLAIHVNTQGVGDFSRAVQEVVLLDNEGNVIAMEHVIHDDIVEFDGIDHVVEGSDRVIVKLVTDRIGDNENGEVLTDARLGLEIVEAQGVNTETPTEVSYINSSLPNISQYGDLFSVLPVMFESINTVPSAFGVGVNTTVSNGSGISLGIFRLVAADRDNTNRNDGSNLEIVLNTLNIYSTNVSDVTNYKIRLLGVTNPQWIQGTVEGEVVTFDLTQLTSSHREIASGTTRYFEVQGDVFATSNGTVRIGMRNTNGNSSGDVPGLLFGPSDMLTELYTESVTSDGVYADVIMIETN